MGGDAYQPLITVVVVQKRHQVPVQMDIAGCKRMGGDEYQPLITVVVVQKRHGREEYGTFRF